MQYRRASTLGPLQEQLGIPTNARVFHQIITDGPMGAYIWNLDTGNISIVVQGGHYNPIKPGRNEVPQHVKKIIAATDNDLNNLWLTTVGLDEVRETISSELAFRGIDER